MQIYIPQLVCALLFCLCSVAHGILQSPSEVTATAAGPSAVAIAWVDNESGETEYIIQRDDSGWTTIATLPANSSHYYDRGLTLGSSHNYRVYAQNTMDVSAAVETGVVTTMAFKPNMLFFLADDMGFKDIVALREPAIDGPTLHETPALDSFIDSVALSVNNAYCSGPRCVVARRSIQTGNYDWRPDVVPNNDYYVDKDGNPEGGGLWAGGTTVAGSESGAGVNIPFDNETIGEAMQAAGYRTAFIGKYHLGESAPSLHTPTGYSFGDQPGRGPIDQGYDVSIAAGHAGAPPSSYFAVLNQNPGAGPDEYTFELLDLDDTSYMLTPAVPAEGDYITDRMTAKAIGFIDHAINNHSSQPFHLTLAHYAVHTPMEAQSNVNAPDGRGYEYFQAQKALRSAEFAAHPGGAALVEDYSSMTRITQDNAVYAAMMKSYDASFGALWSYLQATDDPRNPGMKLSETTVIVISSDHGGKSTTPIEDNKDLEDDLTDTVNPAPVYLPADNAYRSAFGNAYSSYPTSNYPYRHGKTWVFEGGLKVPLIIYVPGLTVGGTETNAFVHHADLFASFVDLSGGAQSVNSRDSVSFMLAAGQPDRSARDEHFHFFTNANSGTGNPAIGAYRRGDYKLLYFMVQRRVELYNLAADPYEKNDLAQARPDLAAEMLDRLYREVLATGISMPKPGSNTWSSEQAILVDNGVIGSLPAVPDAAPSWVGVGVSQVSDTTLELNWQVNATNATHSIIYRRADANGETNFREVAYLPVDVTTFRDVDLQPGGQYRYRVESENLAGWAADDTGNKTITLGSVGDLACVASDDNVTAAPGEQRRFNPLLNDEGEGALLITAISQPTGGSATFDGTHIVFEAPDGFSGGVILTYTIEDSASQTDTATVSIELPITEATEIELEAWEFDDSSGTDLNDLSNTGTWGSIWRFNTTAATNGAGSFVIPGNSGSTTRRLPERGTANALAGDDFYASPASQGKYRFEAQFASWSVDPSSAGDSLTLQVSDSSNVSLARVDLRLNASDVEVRLSAFDGNFRVYSYSLAQNDAVTAAVEFDFENDSVDYLIDGVIQHTFVFNGSDIGRLSYIQGGTWGTAATSVQLNHLKLIQLVPGGSIYDAYASTFPWLGVLERDPDDDPDGDSISNLIEFAFGLDLLSPNGSIPLEVVENSGLAVRFTPARDPDALEYTVRLSDDLMDWETIPSVTVNSAAGVPVEVSLPVGDQGFARVEVSEL